MTMARAMMPARTPARVSDAVPARWRDTPRHGPLPVSFKHRKVREMDLLTIMLAGLLLIAVAARPKPTEAADREDAEDTDKKQQ